MSGKEKRRGQSRMRTAWPAWWVMFTREFADLWIGGKALGLILIYSLLLGGLTYLFASNGEMSLIPPNEMVWETLKVALAVGLFISLIIGADSISGERERATLEGLLLTPLSRRHIVAGKFLAAVSPWPVALLISVPFMRTLAQGDQIFGPAVLWGAIFGSLLVTMLTSIGMIISFWCNSNKTSMFLSLGIYLLFLLPTQLPGPAENGTLGHTFQWLNPLQATNYFLAKHLVNNRTLGELWHWLATPVLFALGGLAVLFWYAGPGLRLERGRTSRFGTYWRRIVGLSVIAGLMVWLGTTPAMALQEKEEDSEVAQPALSISIDMRHNVVRSGDPTLFNTVVKNSGTEAAPPLIVAMNIINLDATGDIVDPEDWSPQRTQYLESLAPGQSATLSWRVNAIFDGDYMVYMVLIPTPEEQEETSRPVASSGIHLTVTPYTRINPSGVLPFVIGTPVMLIAGMIVLFWLRRRQVDRGGASQAAAE